MTWQQSFCTQTPKFKVLLNCSSTTPVLYNQCIKPRSLYTYRWWKAFPSILWYGRWRWVIHWFIVIQENDICLPMKCFKLLNTMYVSPPIKSWNWYMFSQVLSHFYTLFFYSFLLIQISYLLFIGWTMAFKAVSGVNKNVYSTYTSHQTSSEKVFAALEVTNRHFNHYKNRIILKWQNIGPLEVI